MISAAVTLLIYLVLIAAFFQPNSKRLYVALAFVAAALSHKALFFSSSGAVYYVSAALFDLCVIILISAVRPVTKTALRMSIVCLAAIVVNFLGWVAWMLYYPPWPYDAAMSGIYALALAVLLKRDRQDVMGSSTMDSRVARVRFDYNTRRSTSDNSKGEA